MSAIPLHDAYSVHPRFIRSMSLTRDFERADALDGYLLTSTGRDIVRRLGDALRHRSGTRAWSLTGPYGSGKSSFALFVAKLLGGDSRSCGHARGLLQACDSGLWQDLFGSGSPLARRPGRLLPVLVSGTREPIEPAVARQLARALRRTCNKGRPPALIDRLEKLAVGRGSVGVVPLLEEANDFLRRYQGEAAGILLVIDELGKFLEYSSSRPDRGDVFVLQELAESAARSDRPFLFVTILHQAIERYADQLSPSRRTEWAKVQGRFEDVAFEERSDEVLRLLARTLKLNASPPSLDFLRRSANDFARRALALGIRVGTLSESELRRALAACHPLHPFTAVVLGPLFRQLAQNERSLFAFLSSTEPFGFQEFLRNGAVSKDDCDVYRLDQLYDYIIASLGPSLLAQPRGRAWAEVQAALDRLGDASPLEVRVAKTVGLLQAVGSAVPIGASLKVVAFALRDSNVTSAQVEAAIQGLVRRSCLLFRRHLGSYALWEGSDIDIEARIGEAHRAVDRELKLPDFLSAQAPAPSHVARRHYFRTGTLRFFEAVYTDLERLPGLLALEPVGSDGRLIFCLPSTNEESEAIRRAIVSAPRSNRPTIVALPVDVSQLREHCYEFGCLTWVLRNTPELEADRIARKELHARLSHTEDALRSHMAWLFTPGAGDTDRCVWFAGGQEKELRSQRDLNDLVSELCDRAYSATPRWRNELINRRILSSAASKARRNLVEAMIERGQVENLGIQGAPPERSMYEALLRASRLHREHRGVWGFHAPDSQAEGAVREIWQRMEEVLDGTTKARLPISEFFAAFRRPPFGLKDGVLPILIAVALIHFASEVALYEDGTFIPGLTAAVFERICRAPERFSFQRFRIAGPRADVFSRYAAMLGRQLDGKKEPDLLDIVRPLVRFVRDLPEFVSKTTKTSAVSQSVLRTLKEARQPDQLLFSDLPEACGVHRFDDENAVAAKVVEDYFRRLRDALSELQRAYPNLLIDVERLTLQALGRSGTLADARRELAHEARLILNLALDARVKSFLLRLADSDTDETMWLEAVGTLLAGRPPASWDDTDQARFEVQLSAAARSFRHYAALAFEMERAGFALLDGDPRMLRISVTSLNAGEVERVVQVPAHLAGQAEDVLRELRDVLSRAKFLQDPDASAAVLARLARDVLASSEMTIEEPHKSKGGTHRRDTLRSLGENGSR